MSLTAGINIAKSALTTISAQTEVTSRNIAGAGEDGYVRRSAYPVTAAGGGAQLFSITRDQNFLLFNRLLEVTSSQGGRSAVVDGLDRLERIFDDPTYGQSPSALIGDLENALQLYADAPHDAALAATAVARAASLAEGLNAASATVQEVRAQTDAAMAASVDRVNSLLTQFEQVNTQITTTRATDPGRNDLFDTRDNLLTQLSQELGIKTAVRGNDDMVIYTDGGVTLFEKVARPVSFQATQIYQPGTQGGAVVVDGVAVTGSNAPMPLREGRLAGLARLRDDLAPQVQSHLDEVARSLIEIFAETDQSVPAALPPAAGLFTYSGGPAIPAAGTLLIGLAGDIAINASVDPAQGGDPLLLRDGGISAPAYQYNQTGAAGYTERLRELTGALGQTQAFDPAAGLGDTATIGEFSASAAGWMGETRSTAHAQADYHTTLMERASLTLSHRTGVSIDEEMTHLLDLERSYQASARLLTAVDTMYAALFSAV